MSSTKQPPRESQAEISTTHLRLILRGARRIPSLHRKYLDNLDPQQPLSLANLPVLTPHELSVATGELLRDRGPDDGSVIYVGGGTHARPSMSLLPQGMFVEEIHGSWGALKPGDVLANFFPAGRTFPTHCFYNRLATHAGASALSVGDVQEGQFDRWLDFCAEYGVSVIAAPPDIVGRLLRHVAAGHSVPWLRKLLIGGAFHDPTPQREIAERLPDVEVWQLYGSAEAWMVGHRGPGCAEGVFHLLPHQYAEIDGGRILVTTTGVHRAPPLIRYLIGDRGALADCGCGRPGRVIRVLGRITPAVVYQGRPIRARELVDLALETGEVTAAQVAVVTTEGGDETTGALELRVVLADGVPDDHYTREWIRFQALSGHLALDPRAAEHAEGFQVVVVDRLADDGSGEPPALVVEEAG
ncbi:AMP-binding protein [Streptomyces sp. NPDC127098]|uniref:AMP-binding protein n=1 Tax=Streptomyces sp. NPDC127098 TaxID=3347137 RepID=UPI003655C558